MPKLDIDQFEDTPHVGDKVKVLGKVKSIDEDTGEVDVSYDDVSIVKKHKKNRDNSDDNNDDDNNDTVVYDNMPPNTQSLDQALAQSFPNTQ